MVRDKGPKCSLVSSTIWEKKSLVVKKTLENIENLLQIHNLVLSKV